MRRCLPESLEKITADQAFEVPLPDESCRKRLFELYARGLKLAVSSFDGFVKRTEGASAAFIRELLRKGALFAADDGSAGGRV